jgi:hypothetical protein
MIGLRNKISPETHTRFPDGCSDPIEVFDWINPARVTRFLLSRRSIDRAALGMMSSSSRPRTDLIVSAKSMFTLVGKEPDKGPPEAEGAHLIPRCENALI